MSSPNAKDYYNFYPLETFKYSKIFRSRAKLWAADVHRLASREDLYSSFNVFFWRNHPVKWAQVAGRVVAIQPKESHCRVTLDDSSGMTIDLIVTAPEQRALIDLDEEDCLISRPIAIGSFIRGSGEICEQFKVRHIEAAHLDYSSNPLAELDAWNARSDLKFGLLSKEWVIDHDPLRAAPRAEAMRTQDQNNLHVAPTRASAQAIDLEERARVKSAKDTICAILLKQGRIKAAQFAKLPSVHNIISRTSGGQRDQRRPCKTSMEHRVLVLLKEMEIDGLIETLPDGSITLVSSEEVSHETFPQLVTCSKELENEWRSPSPSKGHANAPNRPQAARINLRHVLKKGIRRYGLNVKCFTVKDLKEDKEISALLMHHLEPFEDCETESQRYLRAFLSEMALNGHLRRHVNGAYEVVR